MTSNDKATGLVQGTIWSARLLRRLLQRLQPRRRLIGWQSSLRRGRPTMKLGCMAKTMGGDQAMATGTSRLLFRPFTISFHVERLGQNFPEWARNEREKHFIRPLFLQQQPRSRRPVSDRPSCRPALAGAFRLIGPALLTTCRGPV